tara:strand:- start:8 stop:643 length:636 start_codon:yes stop_codon:yes gene_type:complete
MKTRDELIKAQHDRINNIVDSFNNPELKKAKEMPIGSVAMHGGQKMKKVGPKKWEPVKDENKDKKESKTMSSGSSQKYSWGSFAPGAKKKETTSDSKKTSTANTNSGGGSSGGGGGTTNSKEDSDGANKFVENFIMDDIDSDAVLRSATDNDGKVDNKTVVEKLTSMMKDQVNSNLKEFGTSFDKLSDKQKKGLTDMVAEEAVEIVNSKKK